VSLLALRIEAGLSREEVARFLRTSASVVWRWEHGRGRPSVRHALRLCELYGVCLEELGGSRPHRLPRP
jgi:transcriptional regulator with XRE-family HTH domain